MKASTYKGHITKLFNNFSHVIDELKALNVLNDTQTREEQIAIISDLKVERYGIKVEFHKGDCERYANNIEYAAALHKRETPDAIVRLLVAMTLGLDAVKNCPYFTHEGREYDVNSKHDLYAFQTGIVERTREFESSK